MEDSPPGEGEGQTQSGLESRIHTVEITLYCFSVIGILATMYMLWV